MPLNVVKLFYSFDFRVETDVSLYGIDENYSLTDHAKKEAGKRLENVFIP